MELNDKVNINLFCSLPLCSFHLSTYRRRRELQICTSVVHQTSPPLHHILICRLVHSSYIRPGVFCLPPPELTLTRHPCPTEVTCQWSWQWHQPTERHRHETKTPAKWHTEDQINKWVRKLTPPYGKMTHPLLLYGSVFVVSIWVVITLRVMFCLYLCIALWLIDK